MHCNRSVSVSRQPLVEACGRKGTYINFFLSWTSSILCSTLSLTMKR